MNSKSITLLLFILCISFSWGQREEMREKIKAQKVAYITNKLDLTAQESQAFWPIFNAYEAKVETIKKEDLRSIRRSLKQSTDVSDSEANALLDKLILAETNLHESRLQLIKDLKQVIPAQKILKLKAAEDEFNRKLFERLKEQRKKRLNDKP